MILERGAVARSAGWGLFLASSWTWCIGMFLPLILLREWGWRGFWLFAAANVLGAAAVGFWWSRAASEAFMARRRWLLALFSVATIAFQAFFVAWLVRAALERAFDDGFAHMGWAVLDPLPGFVAWLAATGTMLLVVVLGARASLGWRQLGAIATIGSLILWGAYGIEGWRLVGEGRAPARELWFIAPAIMLGFVVCPHLDLSLHRVVRESPGRLPWIVFALSFPLMLLFAASSYSPAGPRTLAPLVAWWFIQASFTSAVHAREIHAIRLPGAGAWIVGAIVVGALAAGPISGVWAAEGADASGAVSLGEPAYLRFLGLYGAVFPAVALLLWRGYRSLGVLGFLAVAIPCFEAGFLGMRSGIDPWGPPSPTADADGSGSGRVAWAILVPMALLAAMLLAPIRTDRGHDRASTARPMR